MANGSHLTETKRALLDRYLRGEVDLRQVQGAAVEPCSDCEASSHVSTSNARVALIPIQTGGTKRPLFYMHVHWVGGAFYSFPLARDLGPDQPFYVFEPYKMDGLRVPPTIEAIAQAYIEAMRAIQPEGPYRLAGFCGGALIAYEMAQQLRSAGQRVELLAIIEPSAGPIRSIRLIGRGTRCIGRILQLEPSAQLDWFLRLRHVSRIMRRSWDENTDHVNVLMQRWQEQHRRRYRVIPPAAALRQDWLAVFIWAVSAYVPRFYPGKITYLLAEENLGHHSVWWDRFENEYETREVHTIPGTHTTCRTTHLPALAQCLKRCLDSVSQTV